MRKNFPREKLIAGAMFAALGVSAFVLFCFLSDHGFFWGDEGYSVQNQFRASVSDYLVGKTSEGTTAPLFFLVERLLLCLSAIPSGLGIDQALWLRFVSIVPAWLTLMMFCWLARWPGRGFSFVMMTAVFLAVCGSAMILLYVWQARPYGLWFLLTSFHTYAVWVILLESQNRIASKKWWAVGVSALALVLCTPFGAMQVFASFLLLAILVPGELRKKLQLSAIVFLLLGYSVYCSRNLSHYHFQWPGYAGFVLLIAAHFRWWLPCLLGFSWWAGGFSRKELRALILLLLSVCAMISVQMFSFYRQQLPTGFMISNRYFIYLLPTLLVPALLLIRKHAVSGKLTRIQTHMLGILLLFMALHGGRKVYLAIRDVDARNYRKEVAEQVQLVRSLAEKSGSNCIGFDKKSVDGREHLFLELVSRNPAHEHCKAYVLFDGRALGSLLAPAACDPWSRLCGAP